MGKASRLGGLTGAGVAECPESTSPRHQGGGATGRRPAANPQHRGKQSQPPMLALWMYYSRRVGQQDKVTRKKTIKAARQG